MAKNLTPKSIPEIAKEINKEDGDVIEPKIISQYPEFNREQIDTDETQKYFATVSSFPDGYKCKKASTRPEPHHQAAYSHGGSQQTIYAMVYTFYENLSDYRMATLEQ